MEGERACANECNYSPLEGVRGVEPSLGEGRVRALFILTEYIRCSIPKSVLACMTPPYHSGDGIGEVLNGARENLSLLITHPTDIMFCKHFNY